MPIPIKPVTGMSRNPLSTSTNEQEKEKLRSSVARRNSLPTCAGGRGRKCSKPTIIFSSLPITRQYKTAFSKSYVYRHLSFAEQQSIVSQSNLLLTRYRSHYHPLLTQQTDNRSGQLTPPPSYGRRDSTRVSTP